MRRPRPAVPAGRALQVLCDYDGTLAPLADHPSKARLPAATKRCLQRLAVHPRVFLAIISGRALRDLKRMVGLHGICYVGNHGLELDAPTLRYRHPVAQRHRSSLARLAVELHHAVRSIPGAWVENKGLTLSVHWRRVRPAERARLRRVVETVLAPLRRRGAVRVTGGHCVMDIRPPVDWDKGRIIAWLRRRVVVARRGPRALVVYLGDDRTDEDAFRAVNRLGGVSVRVGRASGRTAARCALRDPRAVRRWFAECERAVSP